MKKLLSLIFVSVILASCASPFSKKDTSLVLPTNIPLSTYSTTTTPPLSTATPNLQKDSIVSLKTKDGEILIKLYPKEAPNTVRNFISKIKSGFYDGLTFHRVEPGFVVQGGDPKGNGTGGGTIKSEINNIPFKRGSLGLARGGVKEISNDSQFYICLDTETCGHLSGEYVNFGEVISGIDIVDKIKIGDKISNLSDSTK